jgi:hypothetical protein
MSLTFREKSLWLLLLSLVVAFGVYFASALSATSTYVAPVHVSAFIGMLIVLVVIQIVGHAVLAIASRRELSAAIQCDERDALIRLKSTQRASYVLAVGVFCSLCIAVLVPGNFVFVHVLLAFWVLAQATEIVSQLILYRRGV